MSFTTIVLVFLASILGVVLLLAALALFAPLALVVDSARGQMRVRWLLGAEYQRPLPGAAGEASLTFAGKRIRLRPRGRKRKPKREKAKPKRKAGVRGRFLYRCLRDAAVRRTVFRQVGRLCKGILRSVELARWHAGVCLPDPAATGMLAGLQFASGRRLGIEPNFTGENSVFLEIRLHPHRIVGPVFCFLSGLPYRAILREWRASSARAPAQ